VRDDDRSQSPQAAPGAPSDRARRGRRVADERRGFSPERSASEPGGLTKDEIADLLAPGREIPHAAWVKPIGAYAVRV
jgi:hypothetical protein